MPLRTPVLDDRSYAQLRDELIARIPVYAPEWTDHHPSDPGITLLELFAFLGENLLFRFNQLPDATKMAFLDLLHIPLRSAVPATGQVRFETKNTDGVLIPATSRLLAGEVPFQTGRELTAWPLSAIAAIRETTDAESLDRDTREYLNRTVNAIKANDGPTSAYRTTLGAAAPLQPGGDVLNPANAIDGTIYVGLLSETETLPLKLAGGILTVGVVPHTQVKAVADWTNDDRCPGEGAAAPTPPIEWQICTTVPVAGAPDPATADPLWRKLDVVADTTAGLTRPGIIDLQFPDSLADHLGIYEPPNLDAMGAGDQPPMTEDPEMQRKLAAWLRVFDPNGGELPAIEWLDVNVASIEQALSARAEFLGVGNGDADQTKRLVHGNVLGTVELDVEEIGTGRWVPWTQVSDFRASDVDDRHFVLDHEAGTVTAGDGRRGRPWQIGERVRVTHYRYGGGTEGNVGPDAVTKAPGVNGVKVTNPLPVRGGADAEPLPDAVARIPEEFRRHDRAVTISDFRELAEATPGAGVARAETLDLFNPVTPNISVPGAVSVVVFPASDRERPNAPLPTKSTLSTVCRYLDSRRLVTTELHVIPPTYRKIAISVGVSVKNGHGVESVRRWVELVLRQFLAPLPPYGPAGRGWPLGRRVFAPELEAAALQVDGVEFLVPGDVAGCPVGLRLSELVGDTWVEPSSRQIVLEKWEVPELSSITVVDGPAITPGVDIEPEPGVGPAVPVRAPREVC